MAWIREALRFAHTVRYLRGRQVWGRLKRGLHRPGVDLRAAPATRPAPGGWQEPTRRPPTMTGATTFRFLNEEGRLPPSGWMLERKSDLWLYNLHYFDDLNAVAATERIRWHQHLVGRWIRESVPGVGIGWHAYPTSLRIVNWIKWAWAGNQLPASAHQSLAVQARWLNRRLETHLLGNHLMANAKALVFAGCYFEGREAELWLRRGMRLLAREIPEQVLADGGHFERSPMYHALAVEDMLDLLNLAGARSETLERWRATIATWPSLARRMGQWLVALCHPDGEIAFFNDAAMGIAPTADELLRYAQRLDVTWDPVAREGVFHLADSGYVRVQRGPAVLLADVAPIGPDYLPGHAHADTLSFELSVHGKRVVVNSGTSCYGLGDQRERERGTAAHSTVEVDGRNSSEVWAGFRVARRARPFDVSVREEDGAVVVEAAHDGYRRGRTRAVHRRVWVVRDGSLEVVDRVEGRAERAVAFVHLHPDVQPVDGEFERDTQPVVRWRAEGCRVGVVDSAWHPKFGLSRPSKALALHFVQGNDGSLLPCRLELTWI